MHCLPVPNAVVEIWQVDPFGKWFIADSEDLATPYPTFAGAGRAVTGMDGSFSFISAFPGSTITHLGKNKTIAHAPQINVNIKARGFSKFSTILFFGGDRRNEADPIYSKLKSDMRPQVTFAMGQDAAQNLIATLDLVLDGNSPYQTY
jgi:protocatechuate 3,4-dioxygenase beta subunit